MHAPPPALRLADVSRDLAAVMAAIEAADRGQGAAYADVHTAAGPLTLHILTYIRFLDEQGWIHYDRVGDAIRLGERAGDVRELELRAVEAFGLQVDDEGRMHEEPSAAEYEELDLDEFSEVELRMTGVSDASADDATGHGEAVVATVAPGAMGGAESVPWALGALGAAEQTSEEIPVFREPKPGEADFFRGPARVHTGASEVPWAAAEPSTPSAAAEVAQTEHTNHDAQVHEDSMEQYSSFGDAGPRTQSPAPHTGSLYELGEVLGSGGAGTVYRGTQVRLQRPVAIKEIRQIFEVFASLDRSSLSARFAEIVRAQSQLGHPHILRTIDVEVDGEYPRVVMELAPGGNLRRVIERRDQAALSVRLKYLFQVLHALRHAHEAGVTHGGLKPENVLLDAAGNALVTDFGMGQLVDREGGGNQVFVGVGTLSYMSPEQFRRPSHSSVKSDLYSLGIMFYEMLTGKVPGRRSPMPSSFHPDIPRKVDDIFDRMSMDDPAERYATADEVLDDLYGSSEVMGLLDGRGGFVFERSPLAGAAAPGSVQPAVESEPSPAMGEPSAPDGAAEDGDVLGKLNKYGRMFDEE